MQQLSALDATFLHLETPQMPMHVGALHVFELPPGFRGRFVQRLRRHMAERLPLAPVLRRRLWWMPLNLANPAWVDAEVDLAAQVVELQLPPPPAGTAAAGPGDDGLAALRAAVAGLHGQLMDRHRPLWKMHVFEGLPRSPEGLRRIGLYTQFHHAAVDGQAAVALAQVILDVSPEGRRIEARPARRAPVYRLGLPGALRGALAGEVQQVAQLVRQLPATASALAGAAGQALQRSDVGAWLLGSVGGPRARERAGAVANLTLAPRTRLNHSIGAGRALATQTLPLPELKALARALGVTLNDAVLWLCATALREQLLALGELPRKPLVAAVPISLRARGDTASDNQASMSLVSLGTHLADDRRRLQHITTATAAMKATVGRLKSVLPTDWPSIGLPWLMQSAAALYGRSHLADRLPVVANLVISNVPGPELPLYLAGARMRTDWPTSIVAHGLGLNITVQSHGQQMDAGLVAAAGVLPDLQALADGLSAALPRLRALAAPAPGAPAPPGPARPPAKRSAKGAAKRSVRST